MPAQGKLTVREEVLVIGDFLVDENWSLVSHESALSTFSRPTHLRSPKDRACALHQWPGAAGLVAMELRKKEYDVYGLGSWHHADLDLLTDLILSGSCTAPVATSSREGEPAGESIMPPYTLRPATLNPARGGPKLELLNLAPKDSAVGTTRVIRLYRRLASDPLLELECRVDFELPLPETMAISEALSERPEAFQNVVVKDLKRGVASAALLEALSENGWINENTSWFLSSSHPQPAWLKELASSPEKYGALRLAVLPSAAISSPKVTDDNHDWVDNPAFAEDWFAHGHPTRDALRVLEYTSEEFSPEFPLVVAMPGEQRLLAVRREQGALEEIFTQPDPSSRGGQSDLIGGRPSTFLAHLASQMISDGGLDADRCLEFLAIALEASEHYICKRLDELLGHSDGIASKGFEAKRPKICCSWTTERDHWKRALGSEELSIVVSGPGQAQLDLWRAMVPLDGYVETVDSRANVVRKIVSLFRKFKDERPNHAVSAEITASPGFGKSYLVKCLADKLGLRLLDFNITQLVTRENVIACFDAIASAQAQDRSQRFLIFFDEVNAKLGNAPVYDLFLTVLEDGTYLRGGQKFKLDPCAWVFAGTRRRRNSHFRSGGGPVESTQSASAHNGGDPTGEGRPRQPHDSPREKYQDFVSRLDLSVSLDGGNDAHDREGEDGDPQARMAMMCSAVLLLLRQHNDVRVITAAVLRRFWLLHESTSMRTIRKITESFRSIQDGVVRKRNMPSEKEIKDIFDRSGFSGTAEKYEAPSNDLGAWKSDLEMYGIEEAIVRHLDKMEVPVCIKPDPLEQ